MSEGTKPCPFCAETIQSAAVVCRFCGRDLVEKRPPPPPIATPPTKPRSRAQNFAIALACVVGVCIGLWWIVGQIGGTAPRTTATSHELTYRVSGTARTISLTYENVGGTEQIARAEVPWTLSFSAKSGQFAYVSAQNQGEVGSVTCEILLDGKVVKTATSSGRYTIASCSGRV